MRETVEVEEPVDLDVEELLFLLIVVTLLEEVALPLFREVEEVLEEEEEELLPEEIVVVVVLDVDEDELRTEDDGREVVVVDLTLEDGRVEVLLPVEREVDTVADFLLSFLLEELDAEEFPLFLEDEVDLETELLPVEREDDDDLDEEELDDDLDEDELLDCEEVVVDLDEDEVLRLCARASTWNVASDSNIAAMAALLVLIIIVFKEVKLLFPFISPCLLRRKCTPEKNTGFDFIGIANISWTGP